MSWHYETAQSRIEKLIHEAPKVAVQKFYDDYLPQYENHRAAAVALGKEHTAPLFDLSKSQAIVVDTVQIYANLVNYDDYKIDNGLETEASHARALKFLHLHYSACDRVMQSSAAQRVDFHGGRMHAVVLDSSGAGITDQTIAEAFSFISDLRWVADQANQQLANSEFSAHFRIGVDIGSCVAINNGTGLEQEPMFLGSPANHAAKLASGSEPGIYVSDRVREKLNMVTIGNLENTIQLDERSFDNVIASKHGQRDETGLGVDQRIHSLNSMLTEWRSEVASKTVPDPTNPNFKFHHAEPPLKDIKFVDLSPSNSVRMPLASMFADLSGFTNYIDASISQGNISEAVLALYVMREEFQNVVHDDFDGRKVRFIGDCIHAVIADGDKHKTNTENTLIDAAACAGGIRDSFKLCQELLEGVSELGLAIGIEFGDTPISRIGIRGERSVRVASSLATTMSEKVQKECGHNETKFGPVARDSMPSTISDLLDADGVTLDLGYDDVVTSSEVESAVTISAPYVRSHVPSPVDAPRAHLKIK